MPWQPLPLATQTYRPDSPAVSMERLLNLYPEQNLQSSKSPVSLLPTPGLLSFASVGDGPIRALRRMADVLWVVSGEAVYSVDRYGNTQYQGAIPGDSHVHMTDNGTHVAICTENEAYAVNDSGITQLSQSYLTGAAYQDGYGIFSQNKQNFWVTNLDDMTTIDALDFSTADVFEDNIVTLVSDHRELVLFGEDTIERWANAGVASFPFVRIQGGFHERGCASQYSPAKADNSIFFLGNDLKIYVLAGGPPQRISNPAIEQLIEAQSGHTTARGFTYSQGGHTFYVITWSGLTLCYDVNTGAWHERKSESINRWRVNCHEYIWHKNIVGDYNTGTLYELSLTTYDDNSDTIRREIVTPPVHAGPNGVAIHEIRLDIEAGVGLVSGQGSDPQIMMDWSDDYGHSWSNEIWASPGAIGEYKRRCSWNRLGTARSRSFRFAVTDPVKTVFLAAYMRAESRG